METTSRGAAEDRPLHLVQTARPPTGQTARPAPRRRWIRSAAIGAVLATLGLVWFVFLRPLPVDMVTVLPAPFEVTLSAPGTLQARRLTRIGFPIVGRLTQINADIGDRVTAGAVLAQLDDRDLVAAADSARATLRAGQLAVEAARAQEASATATLANARSDYARSQSLVNNGATSRADDERLATTVKTAEAALSRATAERLQAESSAVAAEASERESDARVRNATALAPFDGIVSARSAAVGDSLTTAATVLELVDPASLYVEARFDETAFAGLAIGQPVKLVFRSRPGDVVRGAIARIGHAADAETREIVAEIALADPPSVWAIGQRADVDVVTGIVPEALAVPTKAIFWHDGHSFLWVAVNGRARRRAVELGAGNARSTLVRTGIEAGDRVLVSDALRPFRRVEASR